MQPLSLPPLIDNEFTPRTTLRGVRLLLARMLWFVICSASLLLYAALLPLILRAHDYGDWSIEQSAALFGIDSFSRGFVTYALFLLGLKYLAAVVFVGVAFYIFWRKSNDWLAILVSLTLLSIPHASNLSGWTDNWYLYSNPWDELFYLVFAFFHGIGYAFILLVFFLFPNGRFVPRWMRWLAFMPILLVMAVWASEFLHTLIIWDDTLMWLGSVTIFFALLLLVTWSQIHRYRHFSTRGERAQTRIVVLSLVAVVASHTILLVPNLGLIGFGDSPLGALASFFSSVITPTLLPLGFGVGMLRDELWQSERLVNRAFVYGAMTAILLIIYVLSVGLLSEIFRGSIFGSNNNFVIAAIATGVIALLFQPLRGRLQRGINRFTYGQRDEPFYVLNRLGTQLESSLTPDAGLPLIVEMIGANLRVPYAAIELTTEEFTRTTEYGVRTDNLVVLPLRYHNESVGELKIACRAPKEKFSAADMQLLENLARQAGAVVYTARLNAELQRSRERIVAEREQERRRLRRDLHDGLGPTLASQTMKLEAALDLIHGEETADASARSILQDVKTQMQLTVADIRRIVYELRPPALDDLGLVGALRAHLGQSNGLRGLQLMLDAPTDLPLLSAAVQVNAYRIVIEAVTNVARHANAKSCKVQIDAVSNALHLEIRDDGVGFDPSQQRGVGLHAMRERAAEVGGTCEIESEIGKGTYVMAQLPLGVGSLRS